jgi:hypothetical protein
MSVGADTKNYAALGRIIRAARRDDLEAALRRRGQ